MASNEIESLIGSFFGRATPDLEAAVGAPFDPRLRYCLEAAQAGEDVLAFEDLCSNLYEFDVPISAEEYDELARLAGRLGVPAEHWEFLCELRPGHSADLGLVSVAGVFDEREVMLDGTPEGLTALARSLSGDDGVVRLTPGPPGTRHLESIEVVGDDQPTLLIRRLGARLRVSGGKEARLVLAANIDHLAKEPVGLGRHIHEEHYPGHPVIREGSVPLVVGLD